MKRVLNCPACGQKVTTYRNPFPTVDIIIEDQDGGLVLIHRANPPVGWALPGGFVDYGETLEQAAVREAKEETGLSVELLALIGAYSDPDRDPRYHTMSVAFAARAKGPPMAGSDADRAKVFPPEALPTPLCFDHAKIIAHWRQWRQGARSAAPIDLGGIT